MVEQVLVVLGGRLIDGTGRPPIENSVIVIQKGKLQAIGRSGEVSIPAGAQVIDVKGKTVLPGFIDGHGHLEDFPLKRLFSMVAASGARPSKPPPNGRTQKEDADVANLGLLCLADGRCHVVVVRMQDSARPE